jgi:hypothetical protein
MSWRLVEVARETDAGEIVSPISALRPSGDRGVIGTVTPVRTMIAEYRLYSLIVLTLVVLVSAALWQFHVPARGGGVREPQIAAAPGPAQDPLSGTITIQ